MPRLREGPLVIRDREWITPVTIISHVPPVVPVTEVSNAEAEADSDATEQDDVTRVLTAVAAGDLRPTVNEIRKHLSCSQAKAAAVRKQIGVQA
jgi:hypothetical protein